MASKMSGLGQALQEPEPLYEPVFNNDNEGNNSFTLTPVNANEEMYKEISIDFENADITVVKIEKLVNLHLWKRYVTERDLMLQQRIAIDANFKLNEKYLYHGTSVQKSSICEEGLDHRMSKQGCFGKGIYFSDYPKKCVKYAERGETGASFILLLRVILGTPKVYERGQKDKTLVREPEKTSPYAGYRFYDSVEGCPVNHKEFVVYESRRALVECIISYRRKDTIKSLPAIKQKEDAQLNDLNSDSSDSDSNLSDANESVKFDSGLNNLNNQGSSSSDDEDNNGIDRVPNEPVEALLSRKQNEFKNKTGETNIDVVYRYLLRGGLNVSKAVKLYNKKSTDEELENEDVSSQRNRLDFEIEQAANKKEFPSPGTEQWNSLSEEDMQAVISSLVEDFKAVTGLIDNDDYAKKRLETVKYDLDLAVLAHYEEM